MPWAKRIGFGIVHRNNRLLTQVVETKKFDRLRGIWATSCFCDMSSAHQLSPNRPKIDKNKPPSTLTVVIHNYNFAETPLTSRRPVRKPLILRHRKSTDTKRPTVLIADGRQLA